MSLPLVATCSRGLEEILAGEIAALGLKPTGQDRGSVSFEGGWRDVWRTNLWLRTASRVLVSLGSWPALDGDALAAGAEAWLLNTAAAPQGLAPTDLLPPDRTFAITSTSSLSRLTDNRWVSLKVKDGLVDAQRRRFGGRSSVVPADPEVSLRVFLHRDRATLLLDTSGEPLDRRGYRVKGGAAPVRETLAAACVLAAEWQGDGPVVDPMCGTGTLLAEAGWWALGRPPGLLKSRWAFERLPSFEARAFKALKAETGLPGRSELRLWGRDLSVAAVDAARANLQAAGLATRADLSRGDALSFQPPKAPGLLVVNPPYGERLETAADSWKRLGDLMKQSYAGYRAVVLAGGEDLGKSIGLKPRKRLPVWNGPLEARILVFDLF